MADLNAIAEQLSSLTVMEAAALVKQLETKWGVSAAAPVAVAAAPAAGAAAPAAVVAAAAARDDEDADDGEDNADAHMKRQIMGREVVIAITNGKLDFGPWEQIFYGEFDGQRKKRVLVKIIGE